MKIAIHAGDPGIQSDLNLQQRNFQEHLWFTSVHVVLQVSRYIHRDRHLYKPPRVCREKARAGDDMAVVLC